MKTNHRVCTAMLVGGFLLAALLAWAQGPGGRRHNSTKAQPLVLVPANLETLVDNFVEEKIVGQYREIRSNGVPTHNVGAFPNRGNPNVIRLQNHFFRVPANPKVSDRATPTSAMGPIGVAVNGLPLEPGAAEFWQGNFHSGWQYEPLGGAVNLGLDGNHAHVQPTGTYHYHGLPKLLMKEIGVSETKHSPRIGWAADGFPIYALYGYEDPKDANSKIVKLTASYQLKEGQRPGGAQPSGAYDGAFVQDYEYAEGLGTLDECNGRFTVTPDFPDGTYAYFMTENWPVLPRLMRGTPIPLRAPPPMGRGKGKGKGFPPPPPRR